MSAFVYGVHLFKAIPSPWYPESSSNPSVDTRLFRKLTNLMYDWRHLIEFER